MAFSQEHKTLLCHLSILSSSSSSPSSLLLLPHHRLLFSMASRHTYTLQPQPMYTHTTMSTTSLSSSEDLSLEFQPYDSRLELLKQLAMNLHSQITLSGIDALDLDIDSDSDTEDEKLAASKDDEPTPRLPPSFGRPFPSTLQSPPLCSPALSSATTFPSPRTFTPTTFSSPQTATFAATTTSPVKVDSVMGSPPAPAPVQRTDPRPRHVREGDIFAYFKNIGDSDSDGGQQSRKSDDQDGRSDLTSQRNKSIASGSAEGETESRGGREESVEVAEMIDQGQGGEKAREYVVGRLGRVGVEVERPVARQLLFVKAQIRKMKLIVLEEDRDE